MLWWEQEPTNEYDWLGEWFARKRGENVPSGPGSPSPQPSPPGEREQMTLPARYQEPVFAPPKPAPDSFWDWAWTGSKERVKAAWERPKEPTFAPPDQERLSFWEAIMDLGEGIEDLPLGERALEALKGAPGVLFSQVGQGINMGLDAVLGEGELGMGIRQVGGAAMQALTEPANLIEQATGAIPIKAYQAMDPELTDIPVEEWAPLTERTWSLAWQQFQERIGLRDDVEAGASQSEEWGRHVLEQALYDIKEGRRTADEIVREEELPVVEFIGAFASDPLNVIDAINPSNVRRLSAAVDASNLSFATRLAEAAAVEGGALARLGGKVEDVTDLVNPLTAMAKVERDGSNLYLYLDSLLPTVKTGEEGLERLRHWMDKPDEVADLFGEGFASEQGLKAIETLGHADLEKLVSTVPGRPYNARVMAHEVLGRAEEGLGVLHGVEDATHYRKFAQWFKGFSSEFFLGMNPGYWVRNAMDNIATLGYDGILAMDTPAHLDDYLGSLEVATRRVLAGADDAHSAMPGVLGKASERISNLYGKSHVGEQAFHKRGWVASHRRAWDRLWRSGANIPEVPAELAAMAPDLKAAARSGMSIDEVALMVDDIARAETPGQALQTIVRYLDEDALQALSGAQLEHIRQGVAQAENWQDAERVLLEAQETILKHGDQAHRTVAIDPANQRAVWTETELAEMKADLVTSVMETSRAMGGDEAAALELVSETVKAIDRGEAALGDASGRMMKVAGELASDEAMQIAVRANRRQQQSLSKTRRVVDAARAEAWEAYYALDWGAKKSGAADVIWRRYQDLAAKEWSRNFIERLDEMERAYQDLVSVQKGGSFKSLSSLEARAAVEEQILTEADWVRQAVGDLDKAADFDERLGILRARTDLARQRAWKAAAESPGVRSLDLLDSGDRMSQQIARKWRAERDYLRNSMLQRQTEAYAALAEAKKLGKDLGKETDVQIFNIEMRYHRAQDAMARERFRELGQVWEVAEKEIRGVPAQTRMEQLMTLELKHTHNLDEAEAMRLAKLKVGAGEMPSGGRLADVVGGKAAGAVQDKALDDLAGLLGIDRAVMDDNLNSGLFSLGEMLVQHTRQMMADLKAGKDVAVEMGGQVLRLEGAEVRRLDDALDDWIRNDGDKTRLVQAAGASPGWSEYMQGLTDAYYRAADPAHTSMVTFEHPRKSHLVFRAAKTPELRAFDSVATDWEAARHFQTGAEELVSEGIMGDGLLSLYAFEVPYDSVWTSYESYPWVQNLAQETEIILNNRVEGVRLLGKVNNKAEAEALVEAVKRGNPRVMEGAPLSADELLQMQDVGPKASMGGARHPRTEELLAITEPAAMQAIEQIRTGLRGDWDQWQAVAADAAQADAAKAWVQGTVGPAMRDAQVAAAAAAEKGVDFALHNYSRTRKLDDVLSLFMPYHFWYSRSGTNWMKRLVNNPSRLATYVRYNTMMRDINEERGLRPRFEGRWKLPLPKVAQKALGLEFLSPAVHVDPVQFMFPYATFDRPNWDDEEHVNGWLERTYRDMRTYMPRPYAFLEVPLQLSEVGGLEEKESFTDIWPQTAPLRGITALAGIGGPEGVDIEAPIRGLLGLPESEQWQPYRVRRMLASMAADEPSTSQIALRAQVLQDAVEAKELSLGGAIGLEADDVFGQEIEHKGGQVGDDTEALYDLAREQDWTALQMAQAQEMLEEAVSRSAKELGLRKLGSFMSGLGPMTVSTGEEKQLELQRQGLDLMWSKENPEGSMAAYTAWKAEHPEVQSRQTQYREMPTEDEMGELITPERQGLEPGERVNYLNLKPLLKEINERYDRLSDEHLRENPQDWKGYKEIDSGRYDEIAAAKAEWPMPDSERQALEAGEMPEGLAGQSPEEYAEFVTELVVDELLVDQPEVAEFEAQGTIDWDGYEMALETWEAGLPLSTPHLDAVAELGGQYEGLTLLQILTVQGQRYDSPLEAVARVYHDQVQAARDKYHSSKDSDKDAYEKNLAAFYDHDVPAEELIPDVLDIYQAKSWTAEELKAAYAGVVFKAKEKEPGSEVATLQDEYFDLPKGSQERRDFLDDHPELKAAWDEKRGGETEAGAGPSGAGLEVGAASPGGEKASTSFSVWADIAQRWPDVFELQDQYFSLPESSQARRDFLKANPQLKAAWDYKKLARLDAGEDWREVYGAPRWEKWEKKSRGGRSRLPRRWPKKTYPNTFRPPYWRWREKEYGGPRFGRG